MPLIVLLALALPGCATFGNGRISEEGRLVERAGGFSIAIPESWEAGEMSGFLFRVLFGPEESGFRSNIGFVVEVFHGSLELFVDYSILSMERALGEDNLEVVRREDFVTISGIQGEKVTVNTFIFGMYFSQIIYALQGSGRFMVIIATSLRRYANYHEALFNSTVETFEWIN